MVGSAAPGEQIGVRLYTERYVIRGHLTPAGDLAATLNAAGDRLDLEAAVYDEFGSREIVGQVPFVQVNLGVVLVAALDEAWAPAAEALPTHASDEVLVAVPPFRVAGRLATSPGGDMRSAIEATGDRFIELHEATFWSESLNEPRTRAPSLVVNRALAHLIAPHEERDPWADALGFEGAAVEGEAGSGKREAGDLWVSDSPVQPSPIGEP
jgi:hypothetical protein